VRGRFASPSANQLKRNDPGNALGQLPSGWHLLLVMAFPRCQKKKKQKKKKKQRRGKKKKKKEKKKRKKKKKKKKEQCQFRTHCSRQKRGRGRCRILPRHGENGNARNTLESLPYRIGIGFPEQAPILRRTKYWRPFARGAPRHARGTCTEESEYPDEYGRWHPVSRELPGVPNGYPFWPNDELRAICETATPICAVLVLT